MRITSSFLFLFGAAAALRSLLYCKRFTEDPNEATFVAIASILSFIVEIIFMNTLLVGSVPGSSNSSSANNAFSSSPEPSLVASFREDFSLLLSLLLWRPYSLEGKNAMNLVDRARSHVTPLRPKTNDEVKLSMNFALTNPTHEDFKR